MNMTQTQHGTINGQRGKTGTQLHINTPRIISGTAAMVATQHGDQEKQDLVYYCNTTMYLA
jgi:hypothetical protein